MTVAPTLPDLTGRAAVVTGGASGIGRSVGEHYARAGAAVLLVDLDGAAAESAAKEVSADVGPGATVLGTRADVTDPDAMAAAADLAEREFGHVDTLSCNAGVTGYPVPAMDAEVEEFDRIVAVNVKGPWLSVRAVVPAMRRAGGGAITITGSVMGERARPGFAAYASSKAAANHLTKVLALELAADRIRVNALAPVATDTPMLPKFLGTGDPETAREAFIAGIPLGRLAVPSDVAAAATFLVSDAAAFLTGVVLPVDGGRSI